MSTILFVKSQNDFNDYSSYLYPGLGNYSGYWEKAGKNITSKPYRTIISQITMTTITMEIIMVVTTITMVIITDMVTTIKAIPTIMVKTEFARRTTSLILS
ncbi:MAG: hypothetical protein QM751_08370 [Paludibacteraceae bacterium]